MTLRWFTLGFAASELYRRMPIAESLLQGHRNGLSITILGPAGSFRPLPVAGVHQSARACESLPLPTLRSPIEALLLMAADN